MMGRTSAEPEEVKARAHPVLAEVANCLVRKPGSSQAGAFMAMLAVESPLLGDEPLHSPLATRQKASACHAPVINPDISVG